MQQNTSNQNPQNIKSEHDPIVDNSANVIIEADEKRRLQNQSLLNKMKIIDASNSDFQ